MILTFYYRLFILMGQFHCVRLLCWYFIVECPERFSFIAFFVVDFWSNSSSNELTFTFQPQITITDLRPLTNYNFRIYAVNSLGKSEAAEIMVTTDNGEKVSDDHKYSSLPRNARKIKLLFYSPAKDVYHWLFPSLIIINYN